MNDKIAKEDLAAHLKKCPEWDHEGSEITRAVEFESFPDAVEFVNDLAEIAEEAHHHPDIDIRYSRVILRLTTHDAGGLTEADFKMAQRIDNFVD